MVLERRRDNHVLFSAAREWAGIPRGDWEMEWQKAYTNLESLKITLYVTDKMIYHPETSESCRGRRRLMRPISVTGAIYRASIFRESAKLWERLLRGR
jgi:hypothetical protein